MDFDAEFDAIRRDISQGKTSEVSAKISGIAGQSSDPFVIIKCISLMKTVNENGAAEELAGLLVKKAGKDPETMIQSASALRVLGFPSRALELLNSLEKNDAVLRESAQCFISLGDYRSALSELDMIADKTAEDSCLIVNSLSSLDQCESAVSEASALIAKYPDFYGAKTAYVSSLIRGGKEKEATRYVRSLLKNKSADSNALAGYLMWILGNAKSAGAYASRAVQKDNRHIGGMEILGLSLAARGETDKARIVAGAINEIQPGHASAVKILEYCNSAEKS